MQANEPCPKGGGAAFSLSVVSRETFQGLLAFLTFQFYLLLSSVGLLKAHPGGTQEPGLRSPFCPRFPWGPTPGQDPGVEWERDPGLAVLQTYQGT